MPGCQPTYCSAGVWMGLKKDTTTGLWQWTDGTPLDYLNWGGGLGARPFGDRQYANFYPETFQDTQINAAFSNRWDNCLYATGLNRAAICKRNY